MIAATVVPPPESARRPAIGIELLAMLLVAAGVILLVTEADLSFEKAVGAGLVGYVVVVAATISINGASAHRFKPHNDEGLTALSRGELDRAARTFQPWTLRGMPVVRRLARHNLAVVRARQGDLRGAMALVVANERFQLRGELRSLSAVNLATFLALAGDVALAEAWLAEARRRAADAGRGVRARLVVASAIVDSRNGRTDEAAREIEREWPDLEGGLPASDIRSIRVLRAFISRGGPREAGIAQMALVDARPRFPGEYAWLAAEWPEMRVFLEANGLAKTA
jgi:hypothetical protein